MFEVPVLFIFHNCQDIFIGGAILVVFSKTCFWLNKDAFTLIKTFVRNSEGTVNCEFSVESCLLDSCVNYSAEKILSTHLLEVFQKLIEKNGKGRWNVD